MKWIMLVLLTMAFATAPASETAISTVTESGTVSAGMQEVTLIFSSDFAGTVQGTTFSGATDSSLTLRAQDGQILGTIKYTISAGTIRIVRVL